MSAVGAIHRGGLGGLAAAARGRAVVVIDVFRAATTACVAVARGAREVVPVGELDELAALAARWPDALVLGEREGRPVAGSRLGNSPSLLYGQALRGRRVLLATHSGSRGLLAARAGGAASVWLAGFANAAATVAALRQRAAGAGVLLVPMGWAGGVMATAEDDACADWLAAALARGEDDPQPDFAPLRRQLLEGPASERFRRGDPWAPQADVALCLALDSAPFALRLEGDRDLGRPVLRRRAGREE